MIGIVVTQFRHCDTTAREQNFVPTMAETGLSNEIDRGAPGAEPAGALPSLRAIRLLRLLLAGTILVPLLVGAIAAYVSYRQSDVRAAAALTGAVTVAEENTTKILDTHLLVAARIDDLLATLSDADIHAREKNLHELIALQISAVTQVAAAWVIDADGHELVSARVYPVNPDGNVAEEPLVVTIDLDNIRFI